MNGGGIQVNHEKLDKFITLNSWKTVHKFLGFPQTEARYSCNGCEKVLLWDPNSPDINLDMVVCPRCSKVYCLDCDIFIHETLLSCPTCYILN